VKAFLAMADASLKRKTEQVEVRERGGKRKKREKRSTAAAHGGGRAMKRRKIPVVCCFRAANFSFSKQTGRL
jgi:hypothetical protein